MHREQFRRELEREWEWIESEEKKLEEEKKKVVAEWVAVEEAQREYNRKRESFEKRVVERFDFLPADDVVTFNVGGQLYKSIVRVWTRDRFSILAQLCTTKPKLPKLCVDDDAYYFDRDAWIFQFIYTFLRDNALPDAIDVLRELYCEASFYRVGLLRHAIEAKLLGDDAVLASTAFPRTASSASAPATNADDKAVAASATKPDTSSTSKKTLEKKETTAAGDGGDSKASHLKSNDDRFHELPDPFGFTSKKKGARISWTEDQN